MCIKKVESFEFAGKLYPTEADAVNAALVEIGNRIVKNHAGNPHIGLLEHADHLIPLLIRHRELFPIEDTTTSEPGPHTLEENQHA